MCITSRSKNKRSPALPAERTVNHRINRWGAQGESGDRVREPGECRMDEGSARDESRRAITPRLMDGAMGTMLLSHVAPRTCLEALNIIRPHLVEEIHRSYAEAGAQLALANTFGANRVRLSHHRLGLEKKLEIINRSGLRL